MKHIAVFTSSRSDWGILETLVYELQDSEAVRVTVLASGSHFDSRFANTIDAIMARYPMITVPLNPGPAGDGAHDATVFFSRISELVSEWFEEGEPDALLILGDRFETLACASAAVVHGIPIVHLHGGEVTSGAIDDSVRHALTKLARLHFPVHEAYRRRLVQMGEDPDSIVVVGSLAVEALKESPILTLSELASNLEMEIPVSFLVCAVHPVTMVVDEAVQILDSLEVAFREHPELHVVLTAPAPDPGFEIIEKRFAAWRGHHPDRFSYRASLGSRNFLSLVSYSLGLVGNSSAGLLEVPSLGVPTLNIGSRQHGRVRASSVVDAHPKESDVGAALRQILTPEFQQSARQTVNPIGGDNTSRSIIEVIEATDFSSMGPKVFQDVETNS